jgi:hypothetical protein
MKSFRRADHVHAGARRRRRGSRRRPRRGPDPAPVRAAIGVTGQFSAVDNLLTSEENLVRSSPGCFSDIAEGTVYALLIRIEQRGLVDVQKVPSEKGPPRKVYSLNAQGRQYLEEFWRTWSFLTERLEQLREGGR